MYQFPKQLVLEMWLTRNIIRSVWFNFCLAKKQMVPALIMITDILISGCCGLIACVCSGLVGTNFQICRELYTCAPTTGKTQIQNKWSKQREFNEQTNSKRNREKERQSLSLLDTSFTLCTALKACKHICQKKHSLFAYNMTVRTDGKVQCCHCLCRHSSECEGLNEEAGEKKRFKKKSELLGTRWWNGHTTDSSPQRCVHLIPLSVELEGVEDGWSLLPQVPQMNTVVSKCTHQRALSLQRGDMRQSLHS